ncbi:hypothetical protein BD413DRAFT_611862 [Trametes elegans]|nr:hypothetical protein BD413DRAFT_611862 [Trametes elegans]
MVRHYEDPIALAAAQAMRPKKYLAYLSLPIDLPTPTYPWFRFEVSLIANTLRAEDVEQGVTSDMVIPIYPNTHHPNTPRQPIYTVPQFPFPNCYHWVRNDVCVRIRRKVVPYDDSAAIKVSVVQHMAIDEGFYDDYDRLDAFAASNMRSPSPPPVAPPATRPTSLESAFACSQTASTRDRRPESNGSRNAYRDRDVDSLPEGPDDVDDSGPGQPRGSFATSLAAEEASSAVGAVADIMRLDIFTFNVDDTVELLPLVNLWFEITEHLTAETVPSPTEFYNECDTIMQIIHDARERVPSIPPPFIDEDVEIDFDALGSQDVVTTEEYFKMEMDLIARGDAARRAAETEPVPKPTLDSVDSLQAMASLDPFGFHQDKDAHLLPLVDFCFDLTDHLEEGDIPSPIEFFKERDEIVS